MNIKFELPKLSYPYSALEPYIDGRTMEIHHSKHHQTYVNNLNTALEKHPELYEKTVEELLSDLDKIPDSIRTAVKNNGGGHYNHTFFWQVIGPDMSGKLVGQEGPKPTTLEAINKAFGSFDKFKEEFTKAGLGRFGSGWAWLVLNGKNMEIYSTANQDSPISEGKLPLLAVDVWEHAYYLKYQNKRNEYIENWWNVVNWSKVEELLTNASTTTNAN